MKNESSCEIWVENDEEVFAIYIHRNKVDLFTIIIHENDVQLFAIYIQWFTASTNANIWQ